MPTYCDKHRMYHKSYRDPQIPWSGTMLCPKCYQEENRAEIKSIESEINEFVSERKSMIREIKKRKLVIYY